MVNADTFVPFFGRVEDVNDPARYGRVRVRAYGYHDSNEGVLSTDHLPWFSVLVNNADSDTGRGQSATGYRVGSVVFGFFVDSGYQAGFVLGTLAGMTNNVSDVSGLARGDKDHILYRLREQNQIPDIQGPNEDQGEDEDPPIKPWSEPSYANDTVYPNNIVYESPTGMIREWDETEGRERIHTYHPSGTYDEIRPDGGRTIKIVGDGYEIIAGSKYAYVRGDLNLTIDANCNTYIKGNWNIQVDGVKTEVVQGGVQEFYSDQATQVLGSQSVNAGDYTHNSNTHTVNSGRISHNEG